MGKAPKIIEAGPAYTAFVGRLAAEVFSHFGDYETFLPAKMLETRVRTLVALAQDRPVGFAMYELPAAADGAVDLTAIAVAPGEQNHGIGRSLLARVEERAIDSGQTAVTLTVAVDNHGARRLFEAVGYHLVPGRRGRYEGGQRSVDLRKDLAQA